MSPPPSTESPGRHGRLATWRAAAVVAWSRSRGAMATLATAAAGEVRRRTTPLRALAAGAVVVSISVAGTAMITAGTSPGAADARWVATVGAEQSKGDPPPAQQPVRSLAVPVEPSPPPAPQDGSGDPDSPTEPSGPLPPETIGEFTAWAVMDLGSGAIIGSDNLHETSTTASMIKAWLVADYLRLAGEVPDDPDKLQEFSDILRHSNNEYTSELFAELGHHESIHRLISVCGLTDSEAVPWFWSNTRLSPRDTARMGACLADGRAAGDAPDDPDGRTGWLLNEMRNVDAWGSFGIPQAFPADQRGSIAVKNGWVIRSAVDEYHVNCMAMGDGWSMGVLTRYPAELGRAHGAEICRSLAEQHLR